MIMLTGENVVEALKQAVEDRGAGYVYPEDNKITIGDEPSNVCAYVEFDDEGDMQPSCLAGYALNLLGVGLDILALYDKGDRAFSVTDVLNDLYEEGLLDFENAAEMALQVAQNEQDILQPWGEALVRAIAARDVIEEDD